MKIWEKFFTYKYIISNFYNYARKRLKSDDLFLITYFFGY